MAKRALGPASLSVVKAVDALPPAAWVVACSGGADSLALAWAAAHVAGRRDTPVRAVIVDHRLQPGSDAVAHAVAGVLEVLGLPARVLAVDVDAASGAGLEAAARDARLGALTVDADREERILLGHTLDDQAETVLLGLARGSGVRSLSGMRAARGPFLRPLLDVTRETTVSACAELGLTPWADPMNDDPGFARVRVRQRVLPVLEAELGPGIREALARTATLCGEASALLGDLVDETEPDLATDCLYLRGLAPGLRGRLISVWLVGVGARDLSAGHIASVSRLVTHWRGQKGVDVPGGRVVRLDGRLSWRLPDALG